MLVVPLERRFSRGAAGGLVSGGAGGGQFVDLRWWGDGELGEQVAGGLGELGAAAEGAGRAGEGAQVDAVEFAADRGPGLPGAGLGDADQEQRGPAETDGGGDG